MPDYDFHQLTSHDLEILVRDLLEAEWKIPLESFKAGRDQGIDLRYALGANKTIVQVKHWLKTGLDGLLQELKKEAIKVKKLKPTRYALATSVPLSPADKDKIVEIIGKKYLATGDIYGPAELNKLLGKHTEVEVAHFKLWLASTAVLEAVLHNAEVTSTKFKVRQVYEQAKRYVPSKAYSEAIDMLNKERVVVIAGPPGVGKTTLADLLLYQHLEMGYQAVLIQRDVKEGETLFREGKKQIFYFDDFMGATFLGDRSKVSMSPNDQALLSFINMVRSTPTARLILTTREHVYAQALERSEKLRHSPLDDIRVFLHMPKYSFEQRARILYNHLYFSDLPEEYIAELLRDEFYLKIVKHDRFKPRLIEWLSSYKRVKAVSVADYQKFIAALLHDPSEIWRHAYEVELSDAGRSLLLAIYSLEGRTAGSRLNRAFDTLHAVRASRYGFVSQPEDFHLAMRETANVFIKPTGQDAFEVLDPSVLDLMNSIVRKNPKNAIDVICGARSFLQFEQIWKLAKGDTATGVMDVIASNAGQVVAAVGPLATAERRWEHPDGSWGLLSPSYEHRLAVVISMLERTKIMAFAKLVDPLYARVLEAWKKYGGDINDGVELVRALESSYLVEDWEEKRDEVRDILLGKVRFLGRSDELRELLSVLDTSSVEGPEATAARKAFDHYKENRFYDDLSNCNSTSSYDELIGDLELFRDELKVDVESMIDRVAEARFEHEEGEEKYADSMEDHYKERRAEERASAQEMANMFDTLKDGR